MFKHRAYIRRLRASGCTVTLHRWYTGPRQYGPCNTIGLTVIDARGITAIALGTF